MFGISADARTFLVDRRKEQLAFHTVFCKSLLHRTAGIFSDQAVGAKCKNGRPGAGNAATQRAFGERGVFHVVKPGDQACALRFDDLRRGLRRPAVGRCAPWIRTGLQQRGDNIDAIHIELRPFSDDPDFGLLPAFTFSVNTGATGLPSAVTGFFWISCRQESAFMPGVQGTSNSCQ